MATKIQMRRDTAANWTSANPTLASGERGLETDTKKWKVGDGSTAWTSLAYEVFNPMTTTDDIIVGGSSGVPTRKAKGSNDTYFGVDGSGVLGYHATSGLGGGGASADSQFAPTYDGVLAQSFPLVTLAAFLGSAENIRLVSGRLDGVKIPLVEEIDVTNILLLVNQVGVSLTSGQNKLAIFSSSGSKLGETADQSTAWTSTTEPKSAAIVGGPITLTPSGANDFVWVAMLCVHTNTAVGLRGLMTTLLYNAALAAATYRTPVLGGLTGQTSIPSSITVASNTSSNLFPWIGLN
jgi:hypothetical protein